MCSVQGQQTVVLVEDDEGMRQALARVLKGAGHSVITFECAEALMAALDSATDWDIGGCLVCDVRLPGISGFELHRRITDHGVVPACIFITAYDTPAAREQATRAACAYLVKPFESRSLLALVDQANRLRPPVAPGPALRAG